MSETIAMFMPSLAGGGAERVMINLANSMVSRGHRVELVLFSATGPYAKQLHPDIKCIDLQRRGALFSLSPLTIYLKRSQPKALISALAHCNVVAAYAKKLSGVNTIVIGVDHNVYTLPKDASFKLRIRQLGLRTAMRASYPMLDHIVAVSQGIADNLKQFVGIKKDIDVIYNPVLSPEIFRKAELPIPHPWLDQSIPVIMGVGRLEKRKDFPNLIRAFALLRKQRPARLMILGEGEDRESLEALIQVLQLTNDVQLLGFSDNPYAYMKHADVFVLSSILEGLPTVLIEAMALGTPIVATDCESGPKEILSAAHYGSLVPIQNPEALASAIDETLRQPRKRVEQTKMLPYTVEEATTRYLRLAKIES
jgi:glycosyltransferase involved in cell wall biosynthesis